MGDEGVMAAINLDIADWLRGLGLEQYAAAFRDNDIDGEILRRLTAEDLRELGVASIGHRRRLLDAIAALDEADTAAAGTAGVPGLSSREAIYQACLKRFRPIIMTTMAAMLGALPL